MARADTSAVYRRDAAASRTRLAYCGATVLALPPSTRDAVATDTPAAAATSRSVTVGLAGCGNVIVLSGPAVCGAAQDNPACPSNIAPL
jgi:hypothetical protein